MSDSVRPHRRQPTRLPHPWDSPGKNTGVGCHFLLQCMKVKSESEVAQSCPTLSDPMDCSLPGFSTHGISQARVLEWGASAFSEFKGRAVLFHLPLRLSFRRKLGCPLDLHRCLLEFLPFPEEPFPASAPLFAVEGEGHLQRKPQAASSPLAGTSGGLLSHSPFFPPYPYQLGF